jgi:hypothetical protein
MVTVLVMVFMWLIVLRRKSCAHDSVLCACSLYDDGVRGACVFGEWYVLSTIPYMYKHSYESVVWYNTRILW